MAVDEAILESSGSGEAPPTLRLYAWDPPCLSIGYAQPCADIDQQRLQRFGWECVRRPTGGRAILHTDELTYSITGPYDDPLLAGGVLDSYQRISLALLAALHHLGIPAVANPQPALQQESNPKGPVCFEVPSNYEILVDGKKLVGSAQARRRQGVLQHGSLPLYGDLTRITEALVFPDEQQRQLAAARLLLRATTAEQVLGYAPAWEAAAESFIAAFQKTLNIQLIPVKLGEAEARRASALINQKYAAPEWTARV